MEIVNAAATELRRHHNPQADAAADAIEQAAQGLLPPTLFDLYKPQFDAMKAEAATLIDSMTLEGKTPDELEVMARGHERLLEGYAVACGADKSNVDVHLSTLEDLQVAVRVVQGIFSVCTYDTEYPLATKIPAGKPEAAKWNVDVVPPRVVKVAILGFGLNGKRMPQWKLAHEFQRAGIEDLLKNLFDTLATEPNRSIIDREALVSYQTSRYRGRYLKQMPNFLDERVPEFADVEANIAEALQAVRNSGKGPHALDTVAQR